MLDLSDESIRKDCPHCGLGSFAVEHPLYETLNFRIYCDVHPITEGHILIIPKQHISCVGAFSTDMFKEFKIIYSNISDFLEKNFGSKASFEHGILGQTVYHSHIHLLPFNGKISDIIPEGEKNVQKVSSFQILKHEFIKHGGYLYFSLKNDKFLVDSTLSKPGFFRYRFAKALNSVNRADWKKVRNTNPGILKDMQKDINNLVIKWNKYYSNSI